MTGSYHSSDGWNWTRLPDGRVRVRKLKGKVVAAEHIMTPSEWASVVCSVASYPPTAERHTVVLKFHGEV